MLRNYSLPILSDTPCQTIILCNTQSKNELKVFLLRMLNDIELYGKPIQGILSQYHSTSFVSTPKWDGKDY